jgi:hypothetical protein
MANGRSRDDKCYPTDATKYLDLAWQGHVKPYSGDGSWCMRNNGDDQGADVVVSPGACYNDNQHGTYMYGTRDGKIVNGFTRMCLDVFNGDTNAGKLVWWSCHDGINQKWAIDEKNRIRSNANSAKCVTITGMAANTYRPYNYTAGEQARIASGEDQQKVCEVRGRIYTQGDQSLAPGCGTGAWCCAPTNTYKPYKYTQADLDRIKGGVSEQTVCEQQNRVFSKGDDSLAPGCGREWCCEPSTTATISNNTVLKLEDCGSCVIAKQAFNFPHKTLQLFTNPPGRGGGAPGGLGAAAEEPTDAAFLEPPVPGVM